MGDPRPPDRSSDAFGTDADRREALDELRRLLFGRDRDKLVEVSRRIENPRERAEDVSRVLAQAVSEALHRDDRLTHALGPAVESALWSAVRRHPAAVANALFPVLGPAIRKAVLETFRRLVQSLDRLLESGLSWQGLRWRFQAWQSGRPYAEIVLAHTLLYRVEQVFLIHRPGGLLLLHAAAPGLATGHEDVIAGMLTAVRDFVTDAFQPGAREDVHTIQVGDLALWVEAGPHAVIAAAIRGPAPESIRRRLALALEAVHHEDGERLAAYAGESEAFETWRPTLEALLEERFVERHANRSGWRARLALVLLALLAAGFTFQRWRDARRRDAFLDRLRDEPGLVVTRTEVRHGRLQVAGLRDPMAASPESLARHAGLDPAVIDFRWEPFHATSPEFVLRRAQRRLEPPAGVELRFEDGTLHVSGLAPTDWWHPERQALARVAGVELLDASRLATGESEALDRLTREVESLSLPFDLARATLGPQAEARLREIAEAIRRLSAEAGERRRNFRIVVAGHTDRSGRAEANRQLSLARAEEVRRSLVAQGIPPELLEVVGVGSTQPSNRDLPDDPANRRVTLDVRWID